MSFLTRLNACSLSQRQVRLLADREFQYKARVARLSSSVGDVFPRPFGHCPFGRFRATVRRAILFGRNWQNGLTASICWGNHRGRYALSTTHTRTCAEDQSFSVALAPVDRLCLPVGSPLERRNERTNHPSCILPVHTPAAAALQPVCDQQFLVNPFSLVSLLLLCHPSTPDRPHQSRFASFHPDAGPLSRAGRRNSQPAP